MKTLQGFWRVPYHPVRAFWFLRAFYLLLSADLWLDMVEHGGRYGVGDFNVAHFALLDAILPLPQASLYVGLLISCGFVALGLGLGPAPRWLRGLLAAAYTFAWMLSLHDSYQHHYLISWLLVWAAAYPDLSVRAARSGELVSGWGLPMTCVTCAIVYAFTGLAKSEPEWRGGEVLRALTHTRPPGAADPGKFDAARDLLLALGMGEASIWQMFALATIALQWVIALGYLAAPHRDQDPKPWRIALVSLGLAAAISFHAVAELFHVFEIGLFSYYMLLIAVMLLGPVWLLTPLVRGLSWLEERSGWQRSGLVVRGAAARLAAPLLAVCLLAAAGHTIPLPGARAASWVLSALVLARIGIIARRRTLPDEELERIALSTVASTFLMWAALTQTAVPFDYYRRTAGELHRMGELSEALAMYRLAERHAPEGRSRAAVIREIQRELEREAQHRRFR